MKNKLEKKPASRRSPQAVSPQTIRRPIKVSMAVVIGYLVLVPAWMLVSEWLGYRLFGAKNASNLFQVMQHSSLLFIGAGVVGWIIQHQFRQILKTNRHLFHREEHFRNLYESAPVAYQSLDAHGRILEINQAWTQMMGFIERDVVGQPFERFLSPTQQPTFREFHQSLVLADCISGMELTLRRQDGTHIIVVLHARAGREGADGISLTHSILMDVTHARRHAVEIERLNRLYAVLSQVNQTVVRARSEQEVFTRVCRAAFTYGGFKMVWLGKVDLPNNTVHPVAHRCDSAHTLPDFYLPAAHNLDRPGPLAAAIRHRKSTVCNELAQESSAPGWQQLAARLGVGSVAAFPIQVEGEVKGVFVLYAAESGFFQKSELALLEEAATDVGFALEVLARESRRETIEVALRERQAKLDSLFRAVPAGIGVVVNHRMVEANQAFFDMTGYEATELIGNPIRMIHSTQEGYDVVERAIRQGGVSLATRWRRKDERELDVLVQASWIDPHDFTAGITFVALDITDRINAEVALRHSVAQLEESRRIARLGAYELNVKTEEWSTSRILNEIFGLGAGSDFKRTVSGWLELIHPADRSFMRNYFQHEVLGRRRPFDMEYRIIRHCDKQVRWVHGLGELALAPDGQIVRMVGTIQDITKQKQIEEALCQQEARLSSILQALPSGVGVAHNRVLKEVNQRICEMSGYTLEELIGQSTRMLYEKEEDFEQAGRRLYGMEKRRTIGTLECRWRRKDGELYDVLICSSQLDPADPLAITFTVTDITEKRQLKEQVLRAQRMESIGTLASGVAHDLNNILAPIMLSIDVLRQGDRPRQDLEMLQMLADGTQRGASIVKQLLLFGRGMTGERTLVEPHRLLKEMVRVIRETFPKSITLEHQIADNLWSVQADATQIHQVLLNLCVNARDAMPRGGRLMLHAENVILDELYVQANAEARPGPYVLLQIRDTGTGIRPELLDKIFDPFFTTKEQGKGTGLGLSTVMGILKSHQGFIQVSTRLGEGSDFRVYLPATSSGDAIDAVTADDRSVPQGNGELVLVVDDEEAIRTTAKRILERNGYQVVTANHGAEGLVAYSQHHQIQVLLTDMIMPVMDGAALIRVLKSYASNLRVISMSGLATPNPNETHSGADGATFLRKPFTAEELLRTLNETLQSKANQ